MIARRAAITLTRSAFASAASTRTIATSASLQKDFVQDLYLRELKSYKPKDVAANSHVGQVKEFHSPSAPTAPSVPSSADLAKELDAYEKADVPTGDVSAASSGAEESAAPGETADEYLAFVEKEATHKPSAAHH